MKPAVDYSLYLVVGRENVRENELVPSIEKAIIGGCTIVQLREKKSSSKEFYETALEVKTLTDKYKIPLIINDRVDIALAIDADGVHVGQSDLPASAVRKLIGENKIMGVSVSNYLEARDAQSEGADYLGIGAMFPTDTKPEANGASMTQLKIIRNETDLPLVIIGGMNEKTLMLFEFNEIDGVAVVSSVLSADDISRAAKNLKVIIDDIRRKP